MARSPLLPAVVFMLTCGRAAFALNTALDVTQYVHTAWKNREGFGQARITAIAQTPDGYLWLGTESGLFRFDGVRKLDWQPKHDQRLPSDIITGLLVARDGTLWIGTAQGLASWKDGQLIRYDALTQSHVGELIQDRDGSIWITRFVNRWMLCSVQQSGVTCFGEDGGPGAGAIRLYEDSAGSLWVGTVGAVGTPNGVWRWRPGPPTFFRIPHDPDGIQGLSRNDDGSLLAANGHGVWGLVNGRAVTKYPLPASTKPSRMLRDRDGGVWVGTSSRGLIHVHEGIVDGYWSADGLSGDGVGALFEDREGTIWVATNSGLDRFRESPVVTYSANQGLSNEDVRSVIASTDGSVWLGTSHGLYRWRNGAVTVFRERSVPKTVSGFRTVHEVAGFGMPRDVQSILADSAGRVWLATSRGVGYLRNDKIAPVRTLPGGQTRAIVEDAAKRLWIANQDAGLFQLARGSHDVEQIPWAAMKHQDPVSAVAMDPLGGGLWFGFLQGGIEYFVEGRVGASFGTSDGLAAGRIRALYVDHAGTLWIAAEGGLSRLKDGRLTTLTSRSGLPCNAVAWVVEDSTYSLWLGMPCGLVRIARTAIDAWPAPGSRSDTDAAQSIEATMFDQTDGARILANVSYYNAPAARDSDGRLWFASQGGVGVIDPTHLPLNTVVPPVYIEQVIADRTTYDANSPTSTRIRLPAHVRDLQIDYTALSLVAPEKNRFRYMLEGVDRDWQDVGARRQAFYNNLAPDTYRFRVIASNNSGVWNEDGAVLDFSIAPAYYQTTWFRTLVVLIVATLLWSAYRYRLRQVAHAFNLRLDERVNERTRIARELHDTLLQSFQGLMLRFQSARDLLPAQPAKAVEALDGALDRADQAIAEGRDAIQNLRSSTVVSNELAQAITTLAEELNNGNGEKSSATFRMSVEGSPRELHPIVRDDIHRIAREALRNAFRHAQADLIEADVTYGPRELRLRIRDDGKGIDPEHLNTGRARHWGLAGMRERAVQIGAQLNLWSEVGAGTEVELRIPGAVAYTAPSGRGRMFRKRRKQGGGP